MRARREWGRKGLLVLLGLLWLALTVRGLVLRDVVWVSLIFFLSGLYGTMLTASGCLYPTGWPRSGGPRHLFPPLTLLARLC